MNNLCPPYERGASYEALRTCETEIERVIGR